MKITYDIKNVLILVFLVLTLIFGFKWYLSNDDVAKEKIKELNKEYTKLESEKKAKDLEISKWKNDFILKDIEDKKHQQEIIAAKKETAKAIQKANESKIELDKLRQTVIKTKKEIETFTKNPSNREGDALLISIKNHTK